MEIKFHPDNLYMTSEEHYNMWSPIAVSYKTHFYIAINAHRNGEYRKTFCEGSLR